MGKGSATVVDALNGGSAVPRVPVFTGQPVEPSSIRQEKEMWRCVFC